MKNYRLRYGNVELEMQNEYEITKSSQDISYSDISCDFSNRTKSELPERYQETEIINKDNNEVVAYGYVDNYDLGELRETDIDRDINITLLTPMKMATLRTAMAVGTYDLMNLLEIIVTPLIDDGFVLKEINVTNRQVTVNFLVETVEYCLNNLSNKFNFWWYIDEKKNIYIKDINLMLTKNPDFTYDDDTRIDGLRYIKPITHSDNYANVINFKNVRIYEYSVLSINNNLIVESHNPLINEQVNNIKQNDQVIFNFPVDIKKENIIKSAESSGEAQYGTLYGIKVNGTYSDNSEFSFYISYDLNSKKYEISNNLGFESDNNSDKEFLLIRDSFFNNLITGFKFNNPNKNIKSIDTILSDSALIWNINKFYNDKGIASKKDIISKTGIVELTLDMKESWKTIQELAEIGNSYLNKNSLNYADEIEIKTDKDIFDIGQTIYINKFLINGKYVFTEISQKYDNGYAEYNAKCKNANMLNNFIDVFRSEDSQTSSDKTYQLYVTHYEEEVMNERYEVVQ